MVSLQHNVVINTGISGNAPVVDNDGSGSIGIDVPVSSGTAFDSMKGLLENPENYYVNIHTTQFPGGIIHAQLAKETYRYKAVMSGANEVPAVDTTASATGWITAKISRDANGAINGGTVIFDVNHANTVNTATTFTGLHIHTGDAGTNGPVVIESGVSGSSTVQSATEMGTSHASRPSLPQIQPRSPHSVR